MREPHYDLPETYSFIPSKLSHFIKERETNVKKDENVEKGTRERDALLSRVNAGNKINVFVWFLQCWSITVSVRSYLFVFKDLFS